ncbi:hypothetical protein [Lichenihabitans psoromatis]|uniref:hypothetical protein n=1 Tax=Lichenihabitans psoromatis TaxID=2528642 RepID=UPI0013F15A7A|nr:hypothetical protein [Lichenihabitans psoromatis]
MTKPSLVTWIIVMGLIIGAQALAASQQSPAQPQQATTSATTAGPLTTGSPPGSGH